MGGCYGGRGGLYCLKEFVAEKSRVTQSEGSLHSIFGTGVFWVGFVCGIGFKIKFNFKGSGMMRVKIETVGAGDGGELVLGDALLVVALLGRPRLVSNLR